MEHESPMAQDLDPARSLTNATVIGVWVERGGALRWKVIWLTDADAVGSWGWSKAFWTKWGAKRYQRLLHNDLGIPMLHGPVHKAVEYMGHCASPQKERRNARA